MELITKFEEIKKNNKSSNQIDDLQTLLSLAKKAGDTDLSLEILLYLSGLYRFLRQHDKAIKLLEKEIQGEYFTKKEDLLKVIDEIIKTLLRTEDFIKLKSILYTRKRFLTDSHQKVMQKFYLAVTFEGLNDNKTAINHLLSIQDNISSSNLVSKYLKLSMLYLKEKNITKSKDCFFRAIKFDSKKKNPIFYLAESDLLFYEGDYVNALRMYEEYFIKSKNKRRYLDRYILINIKLGKLDEAWRFYQKYLNKIKSLVSKNYRLIFYKSALVLAETLKNQFEIDKLNYLIQELEEEKPILNQFDNVYQLLGAAFKAKLYLRDRDVIYDIFKEIMSLYKFQKILFIKKIASKIVIYHYSKGLLLEVSPKAIELNHSIIEYILKSRPVNDLYTYDDIITFSKDIYKTVDTKYIFVNGIERNESFDYFIVYSNEIENFDFQQKLVLISSEIIKKQFNNLDINIQLHNQYLNYQKLLNKEKIGFIKIEKGIMHLLNEEAKKLLETDQDYLSFDTFQGKLVEKIFIDELLNVNDIVLKIKTENAVKDVECKVTTDELSLYLTIKEVERTFLTKVNSRIMDLPNELALLNYENTSKDKTIILIDIINYLEFFKDYNYGFYQTKINELVSLIKLLTKNHLDSIYLESFNLFYVSLKTIDKRVIKRITNEVIKKENIFDIRISIIQNKSTVTFDDLIKLRYLISLTTEKQRIIYNNKNFRYNIELAKTILINLKNLIEKKKIDLNYQAVGDWKTNEIIYLKIILSKKLMLGDFTSLLRVIKSNGLEIEWDFLLINQLIKNLKKAQFKGRFMIDLTYKTISDLKQLKKIVRKLKTLENPLKNYAFILNFSEIIECNNILENLKYLKEEDIKIVGKNYLNKLNIKNISLFDYTDFLILKNKDLNNTDIIRFSEIIKENNIIYILSHLNQTIVKDDLELFDIKYIYGDKYPLYETLESNKITSK